MNLTDFYYTEILGYSPEDDGSVRQTSNTIEHLKDNGFNEKEIIMILLRCPKSLALKPDDLPDELWEGSLMEQGRYYAHHILHITSRPPYYDSTLNDMVIEPLFIEMKIRFTLEDLVEYFYMKNRIDQELKEMKRDKPRMTTLLDKYRKLSFCTPLDFVLCLIDKSSISKKRCTGIFDIEQYEGEIIEPIKANNAEASFHGRNRIIWRT